MHGWLGQRQHEDQMINTSNDQQLLKIIEDVLEVQDIKQKSKTSNRRSLHEKTQRFEAEQRLS
jgi:hypothetical protein